jgi:hypothetical protein
LLVSKCSRGMLTDPLRATRDDHYSILKHNRTSLWIVRFFPLKCLTEPLQEIFSRQDAKSAKKKFNVSPNLARFAICASHLFPIP